VARRKAKYFPFHSAPFFIVAIQTSPSIGQKTFFISMHTLKLSNQNTVLFCIRRFDWPFFEYEYENYSQKFYDRMP
jgi:hypothetical protein